MLIRYTSLWSISLQRNSAQMCAVVIHLFPMGRTYLPAAEESSASSALKCTIGAAALAPARFVLKRSIRLGSSLNKERSGGCASTTSIQHLCMRFQSSSSSSARPLVFVYFLSPPAGKRLYKFVALPTRQELKVFLDFAGPIAFALLGKVSYHDHASTRDVKGRAILLSRVSTLDATLFGCSFGGA